MILLPSLKSTYENIVCWNGIIIIKCRIGERERERDHLDQSFELIREPNMGLMSKAMDKCYCIMSEVVPIFILGRGGLGDYMSRFVYRCALSLWRIVWRVHPRGMEMRCVTQRAPYLIFPYTINEFPCEMPVDHGECEHDTWQVFERE